MSNKNMFRGEREHLGEENTQVRNGHGASSRTENSSNKTQKGEK